MKRMKCTWRFEHFLQYAFAYYAACILACMREQDIEKELKVGSAMTILRAFWKQRERLHERTIFAPTGGLGYQDSPLLWCSRAEITNVLLYDKRSRVTESQARNAFKTFYWKKPFYRHTTDFVDTPTFQAWATLFVDRPAALSPFEALPLARSVNRRYLREKGVWPTDFAFGPDDPLVYQGVLMHGFEPREEVLALGVREDDRTRYFMERAGMQNERVKTVGEGVFQPQTRYHWLKDTGPIVPVRDEKNKVVQLVLEKPVGTTDRDTILRVRRRQLDFSDIDRVLEKHPLSVWFE